MVSKMNRVDLKPNSTSIRLPGSRPIIDIAYQVGYASPSHFSKLFKQHFGQNPLQYRKHRQRP